MATTSDDLAKIRQLQRDSNAAGVTLTRKDAREAAKQESITAENRARQIADIAALKKDLATLRKDYDQDKIVGAGHSGTGKNKQFNPATAGLGEGEAGSGLTFSLDVNEMGVEVLYTGIPYLERIP